MAGAARATKAMAADAVLIMGLNNRLGILPIDLGGQSEEWLPKTKPLPVGAEGVLLRTHAKAA